MTSISTLKRYIANYNKEITMHLSIIYVDCLRKSIAICLFFRKSWQKSFGNGKFLWIALVQKTLHFYKYRNIVWEQMEINAVYKVLYIFYSLSFNEYRYIEISIAAKFIYY